MENGLRNPWETPWPSARQIAFFLQWIMSKGACVDCKYAGNLAVAFGPVKLQRSWPAAIDGPPSGDPRTTSKQKTTFQIILST